MIQTFFDLADLFIIGFVGYLAYVVLFEPTIDNDTIYTNQVDIQTTEYKTFN